MPILTIASATLLLILLTSSFLPPYAHAAFSLNSRAPIEFATDGKKHTSITQILNALGVSILPATSLRVLVRYDNSTALKLPTTVKILNKFTLVPVVSAEVMSSDLELLAATRGVQDVYPDIRFRLTEEQMFFHPGRDYPFLGNYPLYLNVTTSLIGADAVWKEGFTGRNVTVAVIDSGIDVTHPDLNGTKVIKQISFAPDEESDTADRLGHGTTVASIIAGTGASESAGFYAAYDRKVMNVTIVKGTQRGVAPSARLLNVKVFNARGETYLSSLLKGIEWAVNNTANIINLSLGGFPMSPKDPAVEAVERAIQANVTVVVAAGNSGPGTFTVESPGTAPSAITVAASYRRNHSTFFASRGPTSYDLLMKPDILAPGAAVVAAYSREKTVRYGEMWGTSASTPFVSGAAALLLEARPGSKPGMIKVALMKGARDLGEDSSAQGAGFLDVKSALEQFRNPSGLVVFSPREINSFTPPLVTLYPKNMKVLNVTVLSASPLVDAKLTIEGAATSIVTFSKAQRLGVYQKFTVRSIDIYDPTPIYFDFGEKDAAGHELRLGSVNGQAYAPIQVIIPPGTEPTVFTGKIRLFNRSIAIAEMPIKIDVRTARSKVLFDDVFHGEYDRSLGRVLPIDAERLWGGSLFSLMADVWPMGVFEWWKTVANAGFDVDSLRQVMNLTRTEDPWAVIMNGNYPILYFHDSEFLNRVTGMFPKILDSGVSIVVLYDVGFSEQKIVENLAVEQAAVTPLTGLIQTFDRTHPIAESVRNATFLGGYLFAVKGSTKVVATAFDPENPPLSGVAIATYENAKGGRLVALGDSNIFDLGLFPDYVWLFFHLVYRKNVEATDNGQLAINILNFASEAHLPEEFSLTTEAVLMLLLAALFVAASSFAIFYRRKYQQATKLAEANGSSSAILFTCPIRWARIKL